MAELRSGLDSAIAGRGLLFLISGEPGIGKTRLAEQLAQLAAAQGMRMLWGRCWEGGGAPAYWPWIQIVRALVASLDPAGRHLVFESEHAAPMVETIAQIVPELFALAPRGARPQQLSRSAAEQSQFRLFDSIATLLKDAARIGPVVVVLDDLHDADIASLKTLRFIARELRSAAIFIVGTYREVEVQRSPELREQLGDVSRDARTLPLSGLRPSEVAEFLRVEMGEQASAALVGRVHRASGGNPLFVDGIVRGLIAERDQGRDITAYESFRAPHDVREAIGRRLAKLSDSARAMLEVAATIGNEFDAAICMRVKEIPSERVDSQLDEAARDGIVVALGQGRYRFAHALIRSVIHDAIGTAERFRLHRQIADEIEKLYAGNIEAHLQELSHHYLEAIQSGSTGKAIDYAIRAGDAARFVCADEEALSYWSTGLELIEEFGGDQRACAALHGRLGHLMSARGELRKSIEHFEKALRKYEQVGDERRAALIRLELANSLSLGNLASQRDLPRAAEHLRQAAAVLSKGPEDSWLAFLYWLNSRVAIPSSRVVEAKAALLRSIEIAERIGDTDYWALSAATLTCVLIQTGEISDALQLQAQVSSTVDALQLKASDWSGLDTPKTSGSAFSVVFFGGLCSLQLWDPRGAQSWWVSELVRSRIISGQRKVFLRQLEDAYLMAGDLPAARSLLAQWPHASAAGLLAFYEGEWEEADSILERGLERSRRGIVPSDILTYEHALARVRWVRGEPARAAMLLKEALGSYPDEEPHCQVEMVVRPELALIYLEMGRPDEALAQVNRCHEVSTDKDWRGLAGHMARAEAAVLATTGKLDEANAGFDSAVSTFRKFALRWEEAETLFLWGHVLLDARKTTSAVQKLDSALDIYRRIGAGQPWIDRTLAEKARATGASIAASATENVFRKDGDFWTVTYGDKTFRLRNLKGFEYIAYLLTHPGVRIPARELVAMVEGCSHRDPGASEDVARAEDLATTSDLGDAGEVLDAQAVSSYRRRLMELRAELAEAESNNDLGAMERARREFEELRSQLAAGVGRRGRARRSSSHLERARAAVTKNIRAGVERIRRNDAKLGEHFAASIRTGSFCAYLPDLKGNLPWRT